MIIARLCEYAQREKLLQDPAFEEHEVRFLIMLDEQGGYHGVRETQGRVEKRGKKEITHPLMLPVPKMVGARTSAGRARFLVDTIARVVPGWAQKASDEKTHADFVRQVRELCDAHQDEAGLRSVLHFLERPLDDPEVLRLDKDLREVKARPTQDWVTFESPRGTTLTSESAKAYWRQLYAELRQAQADASKVVATCLSCGQEAPVATRHDTLIRGVPGKRPQVALICADGTAFESLGLKKSATSPVCADCAETYTRGLNHLLASEHTRYRDNDAGVVYTFWTRQPTEDDWTLIHQPDPASVAKLLESPFRPSGRDAVRAGEENAFYALSLSGVGGRAMVRDWIEETVPRVRENLRRWFDDLTIILDRDINKRDGVVPEGCSSGMLHSAWFLRRLVEAMSIRADGSYSALPSAPPQLFRAAVLGDRHPLPAWLLAAVVRRVRTDPNGRRTPGYLGYQLPPARAALIRLILNRLTRHSQQGGSEMTEAVDTTQANPGYRCGRLLAVLARLQYLALGSTNATIVDRFYGTASTAPASVFAQLMHLHHAHLGKLAADKPGAATNIRKDIEEITTQPELLVEFPLQLTLQDQGRFALGFYHQSAEYRRRSAEKGGSEGDEPLPAPAGTDVLDESGPDRTSQPNETTERSLKPCRAKTRRP